MLLCCQGMRGYSGLPCEMSPMWIFLVSHRNLTLLCRTPSLKLSKKFIIGATRCLFLGDVYFATSFSLLDLPSLHIRFTVLSLTLVAEAVRELTLETFSVIPPYSFCIWKYSCTLKTISFAWLCKWHEWWLGWAAMLPLWWTQVEWRAGSGARGGVRGGVTEVVTRQQCWTLLPRFLHRFTIT